MGGAWAYRGRPRRAATAAKNTPAKAERPEGVAQPVVPVVRRGRTPTRGVQRRREGIRLRRWRIRAGTGRAHAILRHGESQIASVLAPLRSDLMTLQECPAGRLLTVPRSSGAVPTRVLAFHMPIR